MTPSQFRKLALGLPNAVEGSHGRHPDFRVGAGGKVFASLGAPDAKHGMVKLKPDQQTLLVETNAKVFVPVRGAWGEKGYTNVRLAAADAKSVKHALSLANANCAPKPKRAAKATAAKSMAAAAKAATPGDLYRANLVPKRLMAGHEARPPKAKSQKAKR